MLAKRAAVRPQSALDTCEHWEGVAGGYYRLVNKVPQWKELIEILKTKRTVACDTETSGLSFTNAHIIGYCFSWQADQSFYVPVRHETKEKQLDPEMVRNDLKPFFDDPGRITVFHNAKFDLHFLIEEDLLPKGKIVDTRIMHSLLNEENATQALKKIAADEVHPDAEKWETAVDEFRAKFGRKNKIPKKLVHYGHIPLDIMTPYAASDAHYTMAIYKPKIIEIYKDTYLKDLLILELRLLHVLLWCEHNGVFVDREYLASTGPELEAQIKELRAKIIEKLGDKANPDSPVTLIDPLQKAGVRFAKKTKTGRFSIDHDVLEMLATKHEVCGDILEYRALGKLKSTYVDSLLDKLDDKDRLHCDYNQNVRTGRMSSKAPNLQNIPAKDKTIRKAFVAPKEFVCESCHRREKALSFPGTCPSCGGSVTELNDQMLVFIDYSQMEVRMTGHYSRDPVLLEVYNKTHQDVHTRTMCELWGVNYDHAVKALEDEKHKDHKDLKFKRSVAKMTNFLIIYGGSAKNLAVRISTPEKQYTPRQCQTFIDLYFANLKGVRKWINRTKDEVRDSGYVQNHFGRYRRFPQLRAKVSNYNMGHEDIRWEIERCERQAVNFLIQSSCADLFKEAMVRVFNLLQGTRSRVIMPIHDEIVLYMPRDEVHLLGEIKRQMQDFDFAVPMTVDVSYSVSNWADKKAL